MNNKKTNSIYSSVFKYKAPYLNLVKRWYGVDPRTQRHVVTGLDHEEPNFMPEGVPHQACCRDGCDCMYGRECPNMRKTTEPFHAGFSKVSLARKTGLDRPWYKQGHPHELSGQELNGHGHVGPFSGHELMEQFDIGLAPKVSLSKMALTYLLIIIIIIYLASKYIKHSK
uniref:Uncharacterized protein n=1 Tax=Mimivirus LCMiAC02 TaxID=2506609 RepID=A0A481Z250_9VIRU|nr:MAG: uncharacterized protein LCMiAC02_02180 [Mimivirus LCMiAC02]